MTLSLEVKNDPYEQKESVSESDRDYIKKDEQFYMAQLKEVNQSMKSLNFKHQISFVNQINLRVNNFEEYLEFIKLESKEADGLNGNFNKI